MLTTLPRIAITPGEPAGIGPDIVLQLAQQTLPAAHLIVLADPELLTQRATALGLSIELQSAFPFRNPISTPALASTWSSLCTTHPSGATCEMWGVESR